MDSIVEQYLKKFGVSEAAMAFLLKQHKMFIGGAWVDSSDGQTSHVIEPSTEGVITTIPMGTEADLDDAVRAARRKTRAALVRDSGRPAGHAR